MDGRKSTMLRILTNTIAFAMLIAIAVLLVVAKCASQIANVSAICIEISKDLAFVLVGLASFWYVLSKRSTTLKVVWTICVVAILILTFV